jgi:hypothetical protein
MGRLSFIQEGGGRWRVSLFSGLAGNQAVRQQSGSDMANAVRSGCLGQFSLGAANVALKITLS